MDCYTETSEKQSLESVQALKKRRGYTLQVIGRIICQSNSDKESKRENIHQEKPALTYPSQTRYLKPGAMDFDVKCDPVFLDIARIQLPCEVTRRQPPGPESLANASLGTELSLMASRGRLLLLQKEARWISAEGKCPKDDIV